MAITINDVRHLASLARLGMNADRASVVVLELNTILDHMDVLSRVDTAHVSEAVAGAGGLPLRDDVGAAMPLANPLSAFAPSVREGFLLVPRLASHESAE